MTALALGQQSIQEEKEAGLEEEGAPNFKPHKKFKDYNFTPLNVVATEVLMEIKKDPNFVRPSKILDIGESTRKNQG